MDIPGHSRQVVIPPFFHDESHFHVKTGRSRCNNITTETPGSLRCPHSGEGLPLRRMPAWLRPLVGWLMPKIGPRGLQFAGARLEMKAVASVIHPRREAPRRPRHMLPEHVWDLVRPYGLTPCSDKQIAAANRRRGDAPPA